MAYVLGFFAADGAMYRTKQGGYYIDFGITDEGLLLKIQALLGSDHKISVRQRGPVWKPLYRLQIGSKILFEDLATLGFVQAKSKAMVFPDVPASALRHFVRGYFDGDGHVSRTVFHKNDRPHPVHGLISGFTCGSENFLKKLRNELKEWGSLGSGTLYFNRGFRLCYATTDSINLYKFMYYDSMDLCLERKRRIFEEFLDIHSNQMRA